MTISMALLTPQQNPDVLANLTCNLHLYIWLVIKKLYFALSRFAICNRPNFNSFYYILIKPKEALYERFEGYLAQDYCGISS
jgi:hypothetical protein